jgi:hypothetical protein
MKRIEIQDNRKHSAFGPVSETFHPGLPILSLRLWTSRCEDHGVHIGKLLCHIGMKEFVELPASGVVFKLVLPHIRWIEISFINPRNMFWDKQVVLGEKRQILIVDFVVLYGMHNIS